MIKIYKSKALILLIILMLTSFALSGCSLIGGNDGHSENAILIGVFEPMSGEAESDAVDEIRGIELANELFPEVLGKPVELEYQDNKSTIAGAETAAVNLAKAGASVSIGSYSSIYSIAAGSIFKEAKLPVITATATNPLVTSGNEYYFRACFTDTYQGTTMAKYAFENLGARKALVIYNQDDDFGATVGDIFASKLKDLLKLENKTTPQAVVTAAALQAEKPAVVTIRYTTEQEDISSLLSTVNANDPDVIFLPASLEESKNIIAKIREIGFDGIFLGTTTWEDPSLISSLGEYAEGVVFPALYDQTVIYNDLGNKFVEAYQAKYGDSGEIPNSAALGFDAYLLAINAIYKAGTSVDGEAIRNALFETQEYYGVTGSITFMWSNDPVKSVVLRTVKDGAVVYCDTMMPTFREVN